MSGRMKHGWIAGLVVPLVLPTAGNAAGGAEPPGLEELIYQMVNFVILLGAIVYFARKPVLEFLGRRRAQIQEELDTAAELLSEAEAHHQQTQQKLSSLQSEIEEIEESSRRRAEEESERILSEARRSAERIGSDALAAIDQEFLRAQRELRSEAANLAVEMATEILRQQADESDRERLLDEFIARVEGVPGSGNDSVRETNG